MIKTVFVVAGVAFLMLSCSQQDDSELAFTFTNAHASLINGPTSSCAQVVQSINSGSTASQDVSAYHFQLLAPKLKWSGKGSVLIYSIRIKMTSTGLQSGTYNGCEISGDQLGWLFASGSTPWTGQLDEVTTSVTVNPLCVALKCGGVSPVENQSFTASAIVTVDGEQTDSSGDVSPVRATSNISIEYQP